jgi:hypothetical protein
MGRLMVVLIAAMASVWVLCLYFPSVAHVAFINHGVSFTWAMLLFIPLGYMYHRFTTGK